MKRIIEQLKYIKYPRTYHLPFSPGVLKNDRVLKNTYNFNGKNVVITVKMDGECTTMYHDYIHARSLDSPNHPSQDWVKNFHANIAWNIPKGWRICGENLFAKHSIHYTNLSSYFLVFSIWDENNNCLSWKDTITYCTLLDLITVPILYEGPWNRTFVENLYQPEYMNNKCEGFVVRLTDSFYYCNFRKCVAKYVRASHVETDNHWKHKIIVKNNLAEKPSS